MSMSTAPGFDGGKTMIQNMAEAKKCTIIILDTRFIGMADQADLTPSLSVRMKCSISGTCYFLDAQFRFIP